LPKLTKQEREELKSLVVDASVRRLTAKETCAYLFDKLGVSISIDHIKHLRMDLKHDSAKELQSLQKDRDYYLKCMFWDRLAEMEYQQKLLHSVIDKNEHNPEVQIKAVHELHSITVDINRAYQGLPVLSTYYIPIDGNNIMQQQKQSKSNLDWKDDPSFAGIPGHNLDENYNPRPIYDESDMP
jgi:hypothetical protein